MRAGWPSFYLAVPILPGLNRQKSRWVAQFALIQLGFPEKRHHPLSSGTP
jgi:hypothetical protein